MPLSSRPRLEPAQPPRIGSFLNSEPESAPEESSSFPWAAVVAVFVAGFVLAGVVMYQWGWSRGHTAAAREAVQLATPTPSPSTTVAPPVESPSPSATPAAADAAQPDAAPPVGRLVIQSTPAGAIATIDGRRRGETPVTVEVPLGKHDIQIARSGFVPKTQRVELTKKSAAQTVKVTLLRGPASSGSADVDTQPRGARVSVDGKFVGISPLRVADLSAGEHRFQFELAGHKAVTSTVNIVGGEVKRVTVTLSGGDARKSEEGARR